MLTHFSRTPLTHIKFRFVSKSVSVAVTVSVTETVTDTEIAQLGEEPTEALRFSIPSDPAIHGQDKIMKHKKKLEQAKVQLHFGRSAQRLLFRARR